LIDDRPGQVEPHQISIKQLRDLAGSLPGPAPTAISYETIACRYVPRIFLAAGQGLKVTHFTIRAYRIAIPNGKPIIIDSGMSTAAAKRNGLGRSGLHQHPGVSENIPDLGRSSRVLPKFLYAAMS
jgi:hypothetical protein